MHGRGREGDPVKRLASAAVLLALMLAGCTSAFVSVAPPPPAQYTVTRETSGSACGWLPFGIGVNSRTERAYQEALANAGATSLVDTKITDYWRFIMFGMLICTKVEGTGIR